MERSATTSGTACITEVRLAMGMWTSAVTKAIVAKRSQVERISTFFWRIFGRSPSRPWAAQIAVRIAMAMTPRSAISSPTGKCLPTIFTIVSLQTKDPMAQTMRRPARSAVFCGR